VPGKQRIRSYRDLIVWQRAMALAVGTYDLTRLFPIEERFGLSAQLRRAAVSVPANIAEGHGRVHRGEYVHHLSIAHGSLCEVETMLLLTVELRLGQAASVAPLLETSREVGRMLGALMRVLQRAQRDNRKGPFQAKTLTPDP
jgi:four helix bundle protein